MSLKIIFAGTPDFSVPTLKELIDSTHTVVAVYTQPDRPAGRGRKLTQSPVKLLAMQHNIPVIQPKTLRCNNEVENLKAFSADVMVVVAYGLLLPSSVLDLFPYGCINVHASLLPRWRGAAPIQSALLNGDQVTGITIMQMTEGLDAGDSLATAETKIALEDNSQRLHDRLSSMGAELMLSTLIEVEASTLSPQRQNEALVTYAPKIKKSDALLDWGQSATKITQKIRAYYGWPVAYTYYRGHILRVWQAVVYSQESAELPGTMRLHEKGQLVVSCGEGSVLLQMVQLPGKKPMSTADFLNAHRDFDQYRLG